MKRIIAAILTASLMLSFSACKATQDESSAPSDSSNLSTDAQSDDDRSSEASALTSDEASEEVSEMTPSEKNYPLVTGTFLQPYAFASYSEKQWEEHFDGLLEVGIDMLIIQWTSTTPYSKFSDAYYPSDYAAGHKADTFNNQSQMLERCLSVAEKKGVKVFVGLNIADEWWSVGLTNKEWRTSQAEIGIISAKEIHDLYKQKYPNALSGWYFAWELFNGMQGRETEAGEFLNQYLEPLTEIDASMPLMLSPFVTAGGGDAVKAGNEWKKVFETANFRDGDIFCCQDAVGAGWITIDQLEDYFRELKSAVDTEKGLHFWANNENFTKDYQSAPIERFVSQMNISHPYVENHVTFAYSHYYSKDQAGKAVYHRMYKEYYDTGVIESAEIKTPKVSFTEKDDGSIRIEIDALQTKAGFSEIRLTDAAGNVLKSTTITPTMRERERISITFSVDALDKYIIKITDVMGNTASFPVSRSSDN